MIILNDMVKNNKYEEMFNESERQRIELRKWVDDLNEQLDLLNSKMDILKGIYKLVKTKAKLDGDPIPSEWDEIIQMFFTITTNTNVLWGRKT